MSRKPKEQNDIVLVDAFPRLEVESILGKEASIGEKSVLYAKLRGRGLSTKEAADMAGISMPTATSYHKEPWFQEIYTDERAKVMANPANSLAELFPEALIAARKKIARGSDKVIVEVIQQAAGKPRTTSEVTFGANSSLGDLMRQLREPQPQPLPQLPSITVERPEGEPPVRNPQSQDDCTDIRAEVPNME